MNSKPEIFYRDFIAACAADYPLTESRYPFSERLIPTLCSPHVLDLPADIRTQAEKIVAAFFALRSTPEWQNVATKQNPPLKDPGNTSVLMSYDFHIDAAGALRLIEINTNASLSLVTDVLYRFQRIENVFSKDFRGEILETFAREFSASKASAGHSLKNIAIVDTDVMKQRLFIEFAMYQELFQKRGWTAEFFSPQQISCDGSSLLSAFGTLDLVYNRDTDFYLTTDANAGLREAMEKNCAAITPHPFEYRLLADKDRLLELSSMEVWPVSAQQRAVIERSLIRTVEVSKQDPETLWADRKNWFFKPRRSFGGKAVYRGSSTSRGTFASILAGDYLAQEMVAPPIITYPGEDELKYDLRFYVYRDKIQLACARLYRGQMTNSQSLGGGVAPIRFRS